MAAANYAQGIRDECLQTKKSMAFETVFSSPEKLQFVSRAAAAGFFIRLFFVCTDSPAINAQRVAQRVMEGGHDVPISKIIKRYYKSIAQCAASLSLVDRAYFYDNSINDMDPSLLFRVRSGSLAKTYAPLNPWAEDIAHSLPA